MKGILYFVESNVCLQNRLSFHFLLKKKMALSSHLREIFTSVRGWQKKGKASFNDSPLSDFRSDIIFEAYFAFFFNN